MTDAAAPKKHLAPLPKLALDLGPLLLFFFANSYGGIYFATGAFMVATIVTLAISYYLIRRFPMMPIVTAVIVMVFGALTLWLHNDTFIKLKPTIIYVMFAVVLLAGLATGRPLFQMVLDGAIHLKEEGWKKLTLNWALFFLVMGGVNEFVWRTFTTDQWVTFKTFGFLPLTLVFALSQAPIMAKYAIKDPDAKG
ncbi:MAG TPA: septation protein A [Xanthobacteraceae bacterium]|nr:septation protein A [Xanthobacteraceae bacterium]